MLPMKLTYGSAGLREIRKFLDMYHYEDFSLSIYDIIAQSTIEVICNFNEMMDVIVYVSTIEHDFPAWISINELSQSYVVGISFCKGYLSTPSIKKWENNALL